MNIRKFVIKHITRGLCVFSLHACQLIFVSIFFYTRQVRLHNEFEKKGGGRRRCRYVSLPHPTSVEMPSAPIPYISLQTSQTYTYTGAMWSVILCPSPPSTHQEVYRTHFSARRAERLWLNIRVSSLCLGVGFSWFPQNSSLLYHMRALHSMTSTVKCVMLLFFFSVSLWHTETLSPSSCSFTRL